MRAKFEDPLVVLHPAPPEPELLASGSGVGDQRFWFFKGQTRNGRTVLIDWLMTTTASNGRGGGSERRISDAVFTFDRLNRNQIVLNGVADYAVGNSTFQPGSVATRAITGGTGRYDEVTGQVLSQRFDDGSWSQWFLIGDYDVIVGTDGDDRLKPGGSTPSSMTGLDGADRFVLAQRQRWQMNRRHDVITDFDGAQGDQLVLKTKAFPGLMLFVWRVFVHAVSCGVRASVHPPWSWTNARDCSGWISMGRPRVGAALAGRWWPCSLAPI